MCYTQRKIEGSVIALRESDDTRFLKPNGLSRNLNVYGYISTNIHRFKCRLDDKKYFLNDENKTKAQSVLNVD